MSDRVKPAFDPYRHFVPLADFVRDDGSPWMFKAARPNRDESRELYKFMVKHTGDDFKRAYAPDALPIGPQHFEAMLDAVSFRDFVVDRYEAYAADPKNKQDRNETVAHLLKTLSYPLAAVMLLRAHGLPARAMWGLYEVLVASPGGIVNPDGSMSGTLLHVGDPVLQVAPLVLLGNSPLAYAIGGHKEWPGEMNMGLVETTGFNTGNEIAWPRVIPMGAEIPRVVKFNFAPNVTGTAELTEFAWGTSSVGVAIATHLQPRCGQIMTGDFDA